MTALKEDGWADDVVGIHFVMKSGDIWGVGGRYAGGCRLTVMECVGVGIFLDECYDRLLYKMFVQGISGFRRRI